VRFPQRPNFFTFYLVGLGAPGSSFPKLLAKKLCFVVLSYHGEKGEVRGLIRYSTSKQAANALGSRRKSTCGGSSFISYLPGSSP